MCMLLGNDVYLGAVFILESLEPGPKQSLGGGSTVLNLKDLVRLWFHPCFFSFLLLRASSGWFADVETVGTVQRMEPT